jgi:hypothetical protein
LDMKRHIIEGLDPTIVCVEILDPKHDDLAKPQKTDGTVKSSRCKARTSFQAVRRNLEE